MRSVVLAALLLLGCDSDRDEPPAEAPAPAAEPATWPAVIASALEDAYGYGGGTGMAHHEPGAVAEYVHWVAADDHVVYVTSGAHEARFPHEFVLRVLWTDPPRDERLWEVAPTWPDRVLAEIARVEGASARPFSPGNYLRDVELGDLPYRHFAFLPDPVLEPRRRTGADEPLVFVQVVPLTDAQLEAIDAIETGATNTVLRDWAADDALLLVDPGGPQSR